MRRQVEVIVKLNLEMDANDDVSTEVIAGLQVFADYIVQPVEIVDIKETYNPII